ncbi:MAG: hypothetical protein ACKO0W_12480 [Planctomycetota bacterium]
MPDETNHAERLVFRAIGGASRADRHEAQELPRLDLVGAAIARAARLAAANDRARLPHLGLANTQAAGLLRATRSESAALLEGLAEDATADEGRLIDPATVVAASSDRPTPRFVWRLHPAPGTAGPRLAPSTDGPRTGAIA